MSPVHQVWPKPCKAQWKGEEDKADKGRGGKTTSGNGQAWSSASPRGQWRTGKNGENWLQNHLWCHNDPRGEGIDDDDDDFSPFSTALWVTRTHNSCSELHSGCSLQQLSHDTWHCLVHIQWLAKLSSETDSPFKSTGRLWTKSLNVYFDLGPVRHNMFYKETSSTSLTDIAPAKFCRNSTNTIREWNYLPASVMEASTIDAFMSRTSRLIFNCLGCCFCCCCCFEWVVVN